MTAFEGGTGRENYSQEEACAVVAGDLTSVSHFNKELDLLPARRTTGTSVSFFSSYGTARTT